MCLVMNIPFIYQYDTKNLYKKQRKTNMQIIRLTVFCVIDSNKIKHECNIHVVDRDGLT